MRSNNQEFEGAFFTKWVRVCLFNLLIVAILGCLMRYKIAYALPWLPQKNVLNAHSHFAFAGWLSQVLMVLMVHYLKRKNAAISLLKYKVLLWANLLTAWGMLFAFPFQGYSVIAIAFSTLSIFASYAFAVVYWRDLNCLPNREIAHYWFKAALAWNVLSSIGAFSLAFLMAAHIHREHWYLGAIYFFLHFQYNGWFFFACVGLLYSKNKELSSTERYIFYLLALACLPAYLLSILWAHLPGIGFGAAAFAALMQVVGWGAMLYQIRIGRIGLLSNISKTTRILFLFAAAAATVKFLLQAGSLHPELAKLAFGFRPIVIGYLHLVVLGMLTIFIVAYLKHTGLLPTNAWRRHGMITFIGGIVLQEMLLLLQGGMAIYYIVVPYINQALFIAALIMLAGLAILNIGMRCTKIEAS